MFLSLPIKFLLKLVRSAINLSPLIGYVSETQVALRAYSGTISLTKVELKFGLGQSSKSTTRVESACNPSHTGGKKLGGSWFKVNLGKKRL
jgi:hypothetical protein